MDVSSSRELIGELSWLLDEDVVPSKIGGHLVFLRKGEITVPPASAGSAGKKVAGKRQDGSTYHKWVYPDDWKEAASDYKHQRVADLLKNSGEIEKNLRKTNVKQPTREVAVAAAALLMQKTGMRPGEKGGGETKGEPTFGATSLKREHVKVSGDKVILDFRGKAGVNHHIEVRDRGLASMIQMFLSADHGETDVGELFRWADGGHVHALRPEHVAEKLKEFNSHYKIKDLRTAVAARVASEVVARILDRKIKVPESLWDEKKLAKELVKEIAEEVSEVLGNTPKVAITQYVDPHIVLHMFEAMGMKGMQVKL